METFMSYDFTFIFTSISLGVGLAMDAFSVSLANGLNEPHMKGGRMSLIAGVFAVFQFLMPMIGWFCVKTAAGYFSFFQNLIPWISLVLLALIGGNMIREGIKCKREPEGEEIEAVSFSLLMLQGIATSIDALSVGFTISGYEVLMALASAGIIGIVTFFICLAGLLIGRRFGTRLSYMAHIFGGCILIIIGIEIFIKGIL